MNDVASDAHSRTHCQNRLLLGFVGSQVLKVLLSFAMLLTMAWQTRAERLCTEAKNVSRSLWNPV